MVILYDPPVFHEVAVAKHVLVKKRNESNMKNSLLQHSRSNIGGELEINNSSGSERSTATSLNDPPKQAPGSNHHETKHRAAGWVERKRNKQ